MIYLIAMPGFRLRHKKGLTDVWRFMRENDSDHPAPFPVALPERIIRATDANLILDPFIGSGSTAVAAVRAGRKCIGIDHSVRYLRQAKRRLGNVQRMMI